MTIDIGGFGSDPRIESSEPAIDRVSSGSTSRSHTADHAAAGDETATLSKVAVLMNLVHQVIGTETVRSDRVTQLREAIHSGHYQLDAAEVASSLMSDSEALRS